MGEKVSRREFLRQAVITGVAISGAGVLPAAGSAFAAESGKSRVIKVSNTASINADGSLAASVIEKMVGQGVTKLSGAKSTAAAWKKYFKPADVVGVKINCLFGKGASTHPEVVSAIVAGLKSAGVKLENIIVWDRGTGDLLKSGYTINKDGEGPKYLANDGEWDDEITFGSFKGRLTKIITRDITAMINVPILKTHGIAGITCALKNHYGSFHNPGEYHGNSCDPFMADINAIPAIKDKTRLVIVDAIRPLADGGPGLNKPDSLWNYHSILVSNDPLATDYIGWRIIEERRKQIDLKPLNQPAKWLASGAAKGLGNSDPTKIDLVSI